MRANGYKPQVDHLLVEHKVVEYEVQENVQQGIPAATNQVNKGFARHKSRKKRVEKVDNVKNNASCFSCWPHSNLFTVSIGRVAPCKISKMLEKNRKRLCYKALEIANILIYSDYIG